MYVTIFTSRPQINHAISVRPPSSSPFAGSSQDFSFTVDSSASDGDGYRGVVRESVGTAAGEKSDLVVRMSPGPIRTQGELVCKFSIVRHHNEEAVPFEVRQKKDYNNKNTGCYISSN